MSKSHKTWINVRLRRETHEMMTEFAKDAEMDLCEFLDHVCRNVYDHQEALRKKAERLEAELERTRARIAAKKGDPA